MRLRSSTRKTDSTTTSANQFKSSLDENSAMIMERSTVTVTNVSYQRPIRGQELKKLMRVAFAAGLAASLLLIVSFLLCHHDKLKLYPSDVNPELLKDFASKVEFTLKYQVLLVLWLVINVHIVIYHRLSRGALNPLTECTEHLAQASKLILTNSCEQILISFFTQLIFVAHADGACVLKVIPWFNLIQFIGRIAFFAGYPLYRTFGISLSLWTNTIMTFYNIYKFGGFLNLY